MKKLILSLLVMGAATFASAQCSKSAGTPACCASKNKAAASTAMVTPTTNAVASVEDVAAADQNIQKRVCPETGNASYFEKSVCSQSGSVSWNEVKYDAQAKKFTRVASASMVKDEKGNAKNAPAAKCEKGTGAKCCAKGEKSSM